MKGLFKRKGRAAMPGIDETKPFKPVRIAVLTVSDTREMSDDKSGGLLAGRIETAGHVLADRAIVRDEVGQIREALRRWIADPAIDAVITTGGTGLTGRDITPEAVRPLFDKEIDGFSTVMHMISFEKVGTSTIQSRSLAGVAGGTYIFCLPGSPGACKDAWDGILQYQLDFRHQPCNFVEIMPRLNES
jgi:molybdenum cofactor biosynthesis protein B